MNRNDAVSSLRSTDDTNPNLWRQTIVMPLGAGEHEAFSVGPDQQVWSYRLATREHDAGRLMCTELPAEQFACIRLQDRRVLLASIFQNKLHWSLEGDSPQRWALAQEVSNLQIDGTHVMAQVYLLQLSFEVLVGVLAKRSDVLAKIDPRLSAGEDYQFWVGRWTGFGFDFGRKPVSLRGDDSLGNAFLFGNSDAFAESASASSRKQLIKVLSTP
jgi:hypothetical protein